MSNFVVSARKYRPTRFDEVVGQQHVSLTLKNALQNDHLAHAFLFCGPRGVGKTTCARILAKVLNCQNVTEDHEPCGVCDSCKAFSQNASFNITELDAASNNSVEHIRALIEQVRFQPQQGKYKIFIIDEVHMLSQQAFNAFLKTLEEPPSYAIFILATTEKHKIIPTILSRCQIFDFRRIQVQDMVEHLQSICDTEDIQADPDALHIIGQKADGALRDALSIFDRIVSFSGNRITYEDVIENLNVLDYDYYFRLVDALLKEDRNQVLLIFDEILRKGFDPDLFINGLAEHLRNVLVCKDAQTLTLLEVSGGLKDRYEQQAHLLPAHFLLTALNIANDCDLGYRLARNKRLHVEMALLKMTYINRAFQLSETQLSAPVPEKKTADVSTSDPPPPVPVPVSTPAAKAVPAAPEAPEPADPPEVKEEKPVTPTPVKATKHVLPKMKKLNDMLAEIKEEEAQSTVEESGGPITLERAQEAWDNYIENSEQESVKVIMRNAELGLLGEQELKVIVSSNLAENTVRQEDGLIGHLREMLKAPGIVMRVEVDKSSAPEPPPKPKRLMSSKDKYLAMRETNPLLQEMQKRFDLRPDE
ncbi:MAG: DNA polymerase III subunit gamma/tau [Phaeodactylibacter sp.]|uniref:DNA polymerase III subunit gamma/tau n=1 Tax=Phaeodactylibacter sp. TaxID=1940289 RepID=UPI0032EC0443